ncbi:MAG: hypothetical protein LQ344_007313 [Seirophora lacunosa]|nr:MAG: hypothetical protein LQ344_007313 [Seirophora lacunosa]
MFIFGDNLPDIRESASLPPANVREAPKRRLVHEEDVSFLSLITPGLQWTHAAVSALHLSKLEISTKPRILYEFWNSVGQAASPNIMDKSDGTIVTQKIAQSLRGASASGSQDMS